MPDEQQLTLTKDTGLQVFSTQENFEIAQRLCSPFKYSTIVPTPYQGEQGISNCLIALDMANRMNCSILSVMQNLNVIKGRPSFGATFLIARMNTSGGLATPIRYEWRGEEGKDDWACRIRATDCYGEVIYGAWVSIAMAKAEGWWNSNKKWQSMTEQMLSYRAAAFFQRRYFPELSIGLPTTEEVEDIRYQANQQAAPTPVETIHVEAVEVETQQAETQPETKVEPQDATDASKYEF